MPVIDREKYAKASELEKGAYILSESKDTPQVILIATGSEVHLILDAQTQLEKNNISTRIVSMPSWELFDMQSDEYKEKVLPSSIKKRLSVEASLSLGWEKYVTNEGDILGINKFGESAPGEEVMAEYGFTVENVVAKATALVNKQ